MKKLNKKIMDIDSVIFHVTGWDIRDLPPVEVVDFTPCLERIKWLSNDSDRIAAVQWIMDINPDYANAILRMVYMTGGEYGVFEFLDMVYKRIHYMVHFSVSAGQLIIDPVPQAGDDELIFSLTSKIELPWMNKNLFPNSFKRCEHEGYFLYERCD